jgi:hypothetical protein
LECHLGSSPIIGVLLDGLHSCVEVGCSHQAKFDGNKNGSKEVHIEAPTSIIMSSQAKQTQVLWIVLKLNDMKMVQRGAIEAPTFMIISSQAESSQVLWMPCIEVGQQ